MMKMSYRPNIVARVFTPYPILNDFFLHLGVHKCSCDRIGLNRIVGK